MQLTSLDLSANAIGDDGVAAIAPLIAANRPVRKGDIPCTVFDSPVLPFCISVARQLSTIDLHSANIHDFGATLIADALKTNTRLTSLNLRANYITDNALGVLEKALSSNSTLCTVNLRSNEFTAAGEHTLSELIANHASIRSTGSAGPSLEAVCSLS